MGRFTEIARKSATLMTLGAPATSRGRKGAPYRIKFRGEFLTTKSRKTVWSSLGAAKLAFRNEFDNSLAFKNYLYAGDSLCEVTPLEGPLLQMTWLEKEGFLREIYHALLEETEFVPVSTEDFFKSGKL